MSRLSRRYRLVLALGGLCSCVSVASAIALAAAAPAAATREPLHRTALRAPLPAPEIFELLREDAVLGNVDASAELATRLLDRFEQTGNRDDLHEAMQWIARDWDQAPFLRTDIVNRVVSGHCTRPVLRWHWLCNGGD